MTDREPYLSAAAISAWLGVEPETVREWARSGVIRGYQPGGRSWLFLASEVAADIECSRPRPATLETAAFGRVRHARVTTGGPVTSLRELLRREGRL